jgi:hypothetical protein
VGRRNELNSEWKMKKSEDEEGDGGGEGGGEGEKIFLTTVSRLFSRHRTSTE